MYVYVCVSHAQEYHGVMLRNVAISVSSCNQSDYHVHVRISLAAGRLRQELDEQLAV